jgi:hypothetical protein
MSLVILAVVGVLLTIWPSPAAPAEVSCQALPPGSLSQVECEYIQAKLKEQRENGGSSSQPLNLSLGAVTNFVCPDEKAVEIGSLEGSLGGEIRGTYRNDGQEAVSEVIVGFALFDARNQFVTTIEAAVLPRTIPPGGTGTFAAVVPAPSALGWTCFRYEITGLPD